MDDIIQLVSVLFILSMVCERVAEFFKTYLSCRKIFKWEIVGNTVDKALPESPAELRRHYRILKLNLVCGFATAFLCHASLFQVLHHLDNPGTVVGWTEINLHRGWYSGKINWSNILNDISFITGCILTGAFISLGSKFWHDLLDLLMQVKNAKRSITELNQGTREYDMLTTHEQFELLTDAIEDKKEAWQNNYKAFQGVSIGDKLTDGLNTNRLSLRFAVTEKEEGLNRKALNVVPEFIFHRGYKIPTDVYPVGEVKAISSPVPHSLMPRPLGSSIGRNNVSATGTLGCKVKLNVNGEHFICGVSCYHVLFPVEMKKNIWKIESGNQPDIIDSKIIYSPHETDVDIQHSIGTAYIGNLTGFFDLGFFKTTDDNISDDVYELGKPEDIYHVEENDKNNLEVQICGRSSGILSGKVISVKADVTITYSKGNGEFKHHLKDLIQISMGAIPGDSGSPVITSKTKKLIGLVVAADDHGTTYAIPVRFIENNFPLSFNTKKAT